MKQRSDRSENKDYSVRSVDRALAILEQLAHGSGGLGDSDLAEPLDLHRSTVHRLLAVLERNGFVERDPNAPKYRLGWRSFALGIAAASQINLIDYARKYVAQLVETTGEAAHMGVLLQGRLISIVSVASPHVTKVPSTVGRQLPLHCTSQGKAILAFLGSERRERELDGYNFHPLSKNTIVSTERFLGELALISSRGYAIDNEEYEECLRCVAAPVQDSAGAIIGAISVAGPTHRITGSRLPALGREVMRVANGLSISLRQDEQTAGVRNAK
jgi:DNA-binding IclR family transcriptional regulator